MNTTPETTETERLSHGFVLGAWLVTAASILMWLIEWWLLVGFNELRGPDVLCVPMGLFLTATILNLGMTIGVVGRVNPAVKAGSVEAMGLSGAALLAALSLFATLAAVPEPTLPTLRIRFHWTIVLAFLWISFGVLPTVEPAEETANGFSLSSLVRFAKLTSLVHAVGWAATSGVLLAVAFDQLAEN